MGLYKEVSSLFIWFNLIMKLLSNYLFQYQLSPKYKGDSCALITLSTSTSILYPTLGNPERFPNLSQIIPIRLKTSPSRRKVTIYFHLFTCQTWAEPNPFLSNSAFLLIRVALEADINWPQGEHGWEPWTRPNVYMLGGQWLGPRCT